MIDWVVLTRGDRPTALAAAVQSLASCSSTGSIVVVVNGPVDGATVAIDEPDGDVSVVDVPTNLGVPGGRDLGLRRTATPLVGFLDDDARLESPDRVSAAIEWFDRDETLGAMSLRLVDEEGQTARRHIPKRGATGHAESGPVTTFLGGAAIVRRAAYDCAGGYWAELMYGHEELDLSWRMIDRGYWIRYDADVRVFHPRTEIGRHRDGWWRTGHNRVLIARRNLPFVVMCTHVLVWLVVGTVRAPDWRCRRGYVGGWVRAWRVPIDRRPIAWSTLRRLHRLGRFPVV